MSEAQLRLETPAAIVMTIVRWLMAGTLAAIAVVAGAGEPRPARNNDVASIVRYPVEAETVADARVQGTVFAAGNRWVCFGRNCRAYVLGGISAAQNCAALASEVGVLRHFRAGNQRYAPGQLDACNLAEKEATPAPVARVSTRFTFIQDDDGYGLLTAGGHRYAVPMDWILSREEVASEREDVVSTILFDKQVQAFPLGDGRIGLHVSSYAISLEGSMQAAAGRDIFLAYDPAQERLSDGGLPLGVSKQRYRASGTWTAVLHRFYLRDVDADGRMDIGVMIDEVSCHDRGLPLIKPGPVRWFVFRDDRWVEERRIHGTSPQSSRASELPLLGMTKSPIAYVVEGCLRAAKPAR